MLIVKDKPSMLTFQSVIIEYSGGTNINNILRGTVRTNRFQKN